MFDIFKLDYFYDQLSRCDYIKSAGTFLNNVAKHSTVNSLIHSNHATGSGGHLALYTPMKTLITLIAIACTIPLCSFASEPVGTNNDGHVIDAMALPEAGEGYIHMYHDTNRFWGTSQMVQLIEATAVDMETKFPGRDRMQVEDIGFEKGGEISGHASHENGLDADIGYYKKDGIEHDPIAKNQKYAESMFVNGKLNPNFDLERNWELMKAFHRHGDVQKIFVDINLKKALCTYVKSIKEFTKHQQILRSLRHVDNHKDHLHVRLRCPKDAKKCVNQAEAPKETGC